MNKIKKALKALWWILRKPVLLNMVLTDEDSWQNYVSRKYGLAGGLPVVQMEGNTSPTLQMQAARC